MRGGHTGRAPHSGCRFLPLGCSRGKGVQGLEHVRMGQQETQLLSQRDEGREVAPALTAGAAEGARGPRETDRASGGLAAGRGSVPRAGSAALLSPMLPLFLIKTLLVFY